MQVLIVDDEPISRRLLQNYLEKWGYQVVVAENGSRAWQIFQQGDFRMVISDWLMPEMDGLELVRRIRGHTNRGHVYAILVTVRAQKEDLVEAMEAGADDFISKPFDRDELRVRLREGERIIQLQQALADQNQKLVHAERILTEVEAGETGSYIAKTAAMLRDPIARLQEATAAMQTALARVQRTGEELRELTAQCDSPSPELVQSLERLAAENAVTHETLAQHLLECDQSLRQIDTLRQTLDKRSESILTGDAHECP